MWYTVRRRVYFFTSVLFSSLIYEPLRRRKRMCYLPVHDCDIILFDQRYRNVYSVKA